MVRIGWAKLWSAGYLDDLDQLDISNELRDRMLETMKTVYKLILGTFDEAYNLWTLDDIFSIIFEARWVSPSLEAPPKPMCLIYNYHSIGYILPIVLYGVTGT